MRSRNIKPGFFKNEELAECSPWARLLFIGLWCMADREGRLEKRPKRIKAEIFPYDSLDINGELTVLERLGFIKSYQVDGADYILITHFKDHQRPHHTEVKSKLPDISQGCVLTVNPPLNDGENPPDSLIHGFTDSLNDDSLIPDSPPPDSVDVPPAPSMTLFEIRSAYRKSFGVEPGGGVNQTLTEICQTYTPEAINYAMLTTSTVVPRPKNPFMYFKKVLEGQAQERSSPEEFDPKKDYPEGSFFAAMKAEYLEEEAQKHAN